MNNDDYKVLSTGMRWLLGTMGVILKILGAAVLALSLTAPATVPWGLITVFMILSIITMASGAAVSSSLKNCIG